MQVKSINEQQLSMQWIHFIATPIGHEKTDVFNRNANWGLTRMCEVGERPNGWKVESITPAFTSTSTTIVTHII